ncbi:threonine dehydratase [Rhizobium sp. RU20A]|uniref:threonine ammonia-lyase n=1 Tax=Rhizobium sp. RU20A TaxID=1907412 RepID=UPI00095703B4|nr:pyridoxal-phosphate dependent enzyme [Rhizobium sp. RU20A]SIQ33614.1 threonine dehydratase [Rhizobium sp. RU20A]
MTQQVPPSAARILDACNAIDPIFLNSPLLESHSLGLTAFVKDETDNPIRSFKGRGTGWYIASGEGGRGSLVTASAGNFGQGLAYAATRAGRAVTVFASVSANPVKIAAMRGLGADVVLEGEDFDAAKAAARAYAEGHGLTFVEDGASAAIAEGAGTMAAELTDAAGDLDAVFVPLGNGALAAGIGCWFRHAFPKTRVIAVAARGAPCMALSFAAKAPVPTPEALTIADGIAVRDPVPAAVGWLADTVDEVMLVDDTDIIEAMRFAHAAFHRLVEPAGAAGLAGLITRRGDFRGQRVATMLCGANLTEDQRRLWLPASVR